MFYETRDKELFRVFWLDERENTPQWFQDGSNVWHTTWKEFQDFCDGMWRIYSVDDKMLIYVEKNGEIHLSLRRGEKVEMADLIALRNTVLIHLKSVFGWVGKHNKGMKRIVEELDFKPCGFSMFHGASHGCVLEWECYAVSRENIIVAPNAQKLLSLA